MKTLSLCLLGALLCAGCDERPTSDDRQQAAQEQQLQEGTSETGMPAITNWQERKLMKKVLELRDQSNLVTYTYLFSDMTGKYTYLGQSFGFGLPYATEYTNPQKQEWHTNGGYVVLPQADPNGLFTPNSAEGTWILMLDPNNHQPEVQYVESRISTFTFLLPAKLVQAGY
jgi:hypothetical protein